MRGGPEGGLPAGTSDRVAAFAVATLESFEEAFGQCDGRALEHLGLADRGIRLRYVAPDLAARFEPAIGHLRSGPRAADLEICCWDRSETAVRPPPPPWSLEDFLAHARIRGHVDGPIRATYDATARVLCLYDRDRSAAVMHVADSALVPRWMDRAPFRTILTWWAADRGLALLHASAVGSGACAAVLAGTSGAGKSTTALACLRGGLDFIADDACLVSSDGDLVAYSVYRIAKLELDTSERFPELVDLVSVWHADEAVVDPGVRHRSSAPLSAVLLPEVVGGSSSRAVPVASADALRVLGPTTLVEGGAPSGDALRALVGVVQRVPCYRLELGDDLEGVVDAVRGVLARAS